MPDGGVISGISAVNEKMTELLGIRKEQFTQIAMIPQGDFLKLLLSGTKERAAISVKYLIPDRICSCRNS